MEFEEKPRPKSRFIIGTVLGVAAGLALTMTAVALVPSKTPGAPATPAATSAEATSGTVSAAPSQGSTPKPTQSESPEVRAGDLVAPKSGTWVAMIHWMSKSSYSQAEASAYARTRSDDVRPVVIVDTDATPLKGGRKGTYAVSVVDLATMAEATSACNALGLKPGVMCGRYMVA